MPDFIILEDGDVPQKMSNEVAKSAIKKSQGTKKTPTNPLIPILSDIRRDVAAIRGDVKSLINSSRSISKQDKRTDTKVNSLVSNMALREQKDDLRDKITDEKINDSVGDVSVKVGRFDDVVTNHLIPAIEGLGDRLKDGAKTAATGFGDSLLGKVGLTSAALSGLSRAIPLLTTALVTLGPILAGAAALGATAYVGKQLFDAFKKQKKVTDDERSYLKGDLSLKELERRNPLSLPSGVVGSLLLDKHGGNEEKVLESIGKQRRERLIKQREELQQNKQAQSTNINAPTTNTTNFFSSSAGDDLNLNFIQNMDLWG